MALRTVFAFSLALTGKRRRTTPALPLLGVEIPAHACLPDPPQATRCPGTSVVGPAMT
jgi:hypothetical protein